MILLQNDEACREGRILLAKTCLRPAHCPPCVIHTLTRGSPGRYYYHQLRHTVYTCKLAPRSKVRIENLTIFAVVKKHSTFYES